MVAPKDLPLQELYAPGHRLCAGCGPSISVRMALKAARGPTVVVNSTGCVEVSTTIFPYTAWRIPWVHALFENTPAVASGIEYAYEALEKRGARRGKVDIIALGGDGGTFDIGIQALSGMLERGHDIVYICYDNEAYMNTGIQRSGATPRGAATTTSPAGKVIPGKRGGKKDLAAICAGHGIKYTATASIGFFTDYIDKVRKAIEVDGPAVVHVLAPCPLGWRSSPADTIKLAKMAVQTGIFPIYEVVDGKYKMSLKPGKLLPVEEYFKLQGRFSHLLKPEFKEELEEIKREIEGNYRRILGLAGEQVT
ncbi:MAG: thiamine pyrophosphate-dependent enzyme [Candidatus Bathyarchaeia archaeon]